MRITETCGCGASIEVDGPDTLRMVDGLDDWRRDHRHDSRALRATETDENAGARPETPERDPRSTTASESELADLHGFGFAAGAVIA